MILPQSVQSTLSGSVITQVEKGDVQGHNFTIATKLFKWQLTCVTRVEEHSNDVYLVINVRDNYSDIGLACKRSSK